MMDKKSHYFLAIPIPGEIKEILQRYTNDMKQRLAFKTWVHPEDYHITLVFLGDVPLLKIQELKRKVSKVASKHGSFSLSLNRIGVFGSMDRPRIFWCGVSFDDKLLELQKSIQQECKSLGFSLDNRKYSPHITIARKWIDRNSFMSYNMNDFYQPKENAISWQVNHIVLYQTHLERSPKYQPLKFFPLHTANSGRK